MKKLGLLIVCLLTAYTTFSQVLKPTILLQDKDTLFCFSVSQSKDIAKRIVGQIYCDSIQSYNANAIQIQDSIIKAQRDQNNVLRLIIDNDNSQIKNYSILNNTLVADLGKSQYVARAYKRKRWLYFGAGILTSAVTVALLK